MSIGANTYGTVEEVVALCRVYLHGQQTFGAATKPTLTEVEKFLDGASGLLNVALANAGFAIPVTQTDAKLACDLWVVSMAKAFVEWSQPYAGLEENPNAQLPNLFTEAMSFVSMFTAGLGALGVAQPNADANAILFTGEQYQGDRADPDDTTLEQPLFIRRQFDS